MLPTISVIIPTYNGEAWIADTLNSVFDQTHLPTEIIVVDDASTDGTAKRVTSLIAAAPVPVRLIQKPTNSGSPAPTLNTGLAHATGELIAVLDQDDVFLPSKLERQARALAIGDELSLVFSLFGSSSHGTSRIGHLAAMARVRGVRRRMAAQDGLLKCRGSTALEEFARSVNFVGGFPGFMFRRAAWASKGGFDESLRIAADYEFLCWLCTQGAVGLVPEIHYLRHEHGGNLTISTAIHWRLDAITVLLRYADHAGSPEIRKIVRSTIHHHLWAVARRLASAGHKQAAREVSVTVSAMIGASWRSAGQRLAIPAYVAYYRVFRDSWKIPVPLARKATALAVTASRQLARP